MKARPDIAGALEWPAHLRAMGRPVRTLGASPIREKRLVKA